MTSSTAIELMTNNAVYTRHEDQNTTNVTCLFPRSDSGYGSIDGGSADSPTSPRHSRGSFVSHTDEHEIRSHHGPGTSAERSKVEASCAIPERLPKLSQGLALYRPFLAWKPQQLNLASSSKDAASTPPFRQKCSGGGLRTPDRFVPRRDSDESSRQVYQTTKSLQDLSPTEKLLRRKRAPLVPFSTPQRPQAHVFGETRVALAGQHQGRARSPSSHNYSATRQPSQGNVWIVGGLAPGTETAETDRNHRRPARSSTSARLFTMSVNTTRPSCRDDDSHFYHGRIASALRIDRIRRVLDFTCCRPATPDFPIRAMSILSGLGQASWASANNDDDLYEFPRSYSPLQRRSLPAAPFRVLDAPDLRDDFYCSVLAYSPVCQKLAVGLGNVLYIWSEGTGPRPMHGSPSNNIWLTSVSFSSIQGGKCILAIGRSDGSLVLKSIYDGLPRFQVQQPFPISCVSWRPITTMRPSRNPFNPGIAVQTEDIIVGDDTGVVYYYVVEWPMGWEVTRDTWPGTIYLIAKVSLHSQQICGLAWSPNGKLFASGGNDNLCCLFDTDSVLVEKQESVPNSSRWSGWHLATESTRAGYEDTVDVRPARPLSTPIRRLGPGSEKHRWIHKAAVKAIAFCPWREGLVATGGGSNNKCIHFFHTTSGSALATIAVSAQVTALIWSSTRREIAATFGYTEPEHPYRIAIFSWPECKQVAAIPWEGELRALYAISYPRCLANSNTVHSDRKSREGCIVVASSDKSVKFHEIWCNEGKIVGRGTGMLGGSDILESLEGIDKEGDVIR
ncbi:WD40 repeat-like protein [Trichoderma evansii]